MRRLGFGVVALASLAAAVATIAHVVPTRHARAAATTSTLAPRVGSASTSVQASGHCDGTPQLTVRQRPSGWYDDPPSVPVAVVSDGSGGWSGSFAMPTVPAVATLRCTTSSAIDTVALAISPSAGDIPSAFPTADGAGFVVALDKGLQPEQMRAFTTSGQPIPLTVVSGGTNPRVRIEPPSGPARAVILGTEDLGENATAVQVARVQAWTVDHGAPATSTSSTSTTTTPAPTTTAALPTTSSPPTSAPTSAADSGYVPVAPTRLVDTRPGEPPGAIAVASSRVRPGSVLRLRVAGAAGVPPIGAARGALGVTLDVTVVGPAGDGYVLVDGCGGRPLAASLVHRSGRTTTSFVMTELSADGDICVFSLRESDLVVDLTGWFARDAATIIRSPLRLVDTRPAEPAGAISVAKVPRGAGADVLRLDLAGVTAPSSTVSAVAMTITAVASAGGGHLVAYPCGGPPPFVSSLNFCACGATAGFVLVPVTAQREVCVATSVETHLVIDLVGWTAGFVGSQRRMIDTRPGEPPGFVAVVASRLRPDQVLRVRADVASPQPRAVVLDVAVVGPLGDGFLTVDACGARPPTANLTYRSGEVSSNLVMSPLSASGELCVSSLREVDVVIDLVGWLPA